MPATPIRRIVTGHNEAGRAIILMDGPAPDVVTNHGSNQLFSTLLWRTKGSPASNKGSEDEAPAGLKVPTPPEHKGGTVFRITEFPPDAVLDTAQVNMGPSGVHTTPDRTARHFRFHMTDTVDYAICLDGEIWAMMDEGEVLMKQGDVLIQRGTYHSWSNRSDKVCRMAFILIDAEPV